MTKRNWELANEYRVENYGRCVVCRKPNAELAHIIERACDRYPTLDQVYGMMSDFRYGQFHLRQTDEPLLVYPERVILLCGPATDTKTCHGIYDGPASGRAVLNMWSHLDLRRQLQAVADAHGVVQAMARIEGSRIPPENVPPARVLSRLD